MKPLPWFKQLIAEHASVMALQDQLALANQQRTQLKEQMVILTAKVNMLEEENAVLEARVSELQRLIEEANRQMKIFDELRKKHPQAV
jgi:chromosome segregation ATPase